MNPFTNYRGLWGHAGENGGAGCTTILALPVPIASNSPTPLLPHLKENSLNPHFPFLSVLKNPHVSTAPQACMLSHHIAVTPAESWPVPHMHYELLLVSQAVCVSAHALQVTLPLFYMKTLGWSACWTLCFCLMLSGGNTTLAGHKSPVVLQTRHWTPPAPKSWQNRQGRQEA